jgi:hypothetical protein
MAKESPKKKYPIPNLWDLWGFKSVSIFWEALSLLKESRVKERQSPSQSLFRNEEKVDNQNTHR